MTEKLDWAFSFKNTILAKITPTGRFILCCPGILQLGILLVAGGIVITVIGIYLILLSTRGI